MPKIEMILVSTLVGRVICKNQWLHLKITQINKYVKWKKIMQLSHPNVESPGTCGDVGYFCLRITGQNFSNSRRNLRIDKLQIKV